MRFRFREIQKDTPPTPWLPWFAWRPVDTCGESWPSWQFAGHEWAFLERVERRYVPEWDSYCQKYRMEAQYRVARQRTVTAP